MSVAELIKYDNIYNKEKNIYLLNDNLIKIFNEDILDINFELYKKKGSKINFINNIFNLTNNIKIMLKIHINYEWFDIDYPPRFNFLIILNDETFIEYSYGINDDLTTNKIYFSLILDVKNNDKLNFILKLDTEKNINIKLLKNSFYIIKTL